MNNSRPFICIDLGSSSARIMLSSGDTYTELYRKNHAPIKTPQGYRWDIDKLFSDLITQLDKAIDKYAVVSIGICSWGVDYGLINENGQLYDLPFCYRDDRHQLAYDSVHTHITPRQLYDLSGIYPNAINTLYQLYADKMQYRYDKNHKLKFLMIADLLAHRLTGNIFCEATNASTTGLLSLDGLDWNYPLIAQLSLDYGIFPPIIRTGECYGYYNNIPVTAVCSHDTASAVYAMGNIGLDTAFISSGSWLLLGQMVNNPIITDKTFDSKYTNERGAGNKVLLLSNINGLYVIQKIVKEYNLSYIDIDKNMNTAKVLGVLDIDSLMSLDNIVPNILQQLLLPNADAYDMVKTLYYSLAIRLKTALNDLKNATAANIKQLVITGGATKAPYFMATLSSLLPKIDIKIHGNEGAIQGCAMLQKDVLLERTP